MPRDQGQQAAAEEFNWQIIRKLSLLVLLELLQGCQQNINVFTQIYGCAYGSLDSEENFLEEMQHTNEGMIILNPDSLQSNLLEEYMKMERMDVVELIESLKDVDFVYKHAHVNKDLSCFNFPNVRRQSMTSQQRQSYVKMLEKAVPKLDQKMQELIFKSPDPAEQVVGIIIHSKHHQNNNSHFVDQRNKSSLASTMGGGGLSSLQQRSSDQQQRKSSQNSSHIDRIISMNQGRIQSEKKSSYHYQQFSHSSK